MRLARDHAGFAETKKTEPTLEERLGRHLDKVRANSAPRTAARYRAITAHLVGYFGGNARITPDELEKYKEHRLGEGAKTQTINLELLFLKAAWADSRAGRGHVQMTPTTPGPRNSSNGASAKASTTLSLGAALYLSKRKALGSIHTRAT